MLHTGMTWTADASKLEIEATIRLESTAKLQPYADILLRNADENESEYFLWLCDASEAELIATAQDFQAAELADSLADEAEREYRLQGYDQYRADNYGFGWDDAYQYEGQYAGVEYHMDYDEHDGDCEFDYDEFYGENAE